MSKIIRNLCGLVILMSISFIGLAFDSFKMPKQWSSLEIVLIALAKQNEPKMKLTPQQVKNLISYLTTLDAKELIPLQNLQQKLPKTTLELLFAIQSRGLNKLEAEKMADYLQSVPSQYHIQNVSVFDENTSHIIGREWQEIDYTNEGMTWQRQKAKYAPYGIKDFKSLDNLKKFFPVESKLPYFYRVYGYQN